MVKEEVVVANDELDVEDDVLDDVGVVAWIEVAVDEVEPVSVVIAPSSLPGMADPTP